jgi:hypothetical protein
MNTQRFVEHPASSSQVFLRMKEEEEAMTESLPRRTSSLEMKVVR